jgi:hypothetical protein
MERENLTYLSPIELLLPLTRDVTLLMASVDSLAYKSKETTFLICNVGDSYNIGLSKRQDSEARGNSRNDGIRASK